MSVNEGLRTRAAQPSPRATPATRRVFPAPSGPLSTTTSPTSSAAASASPSASVAAAEPVRVRTVPASAPGAALTAGAATA